VGTGDNKVYNLVVVVVACIQDLATLSCMINMPYMYAQMQAPIIC